MTIPLEDLIRWRPKQFSEDHLTNFARQVFEGKTRWHVAYCNPPSGSWKEIILVNDGDEYLQEIHKRGVGRMKRPDVVAQYLADEDRTTLLLFESKQEKSSWDPNLPAMMRRFFEGEKDYDESSGIRNLPFWHRRGRGDEIWETISDDDDDRNWFRQKHVDYVYGFGYMLGPTSNQDFRKEVEWMRQQLTAYDEVPPIVVMSVGWNPENYEPYVIPVFSETFPEDISAHLKTILPTVNEGVDSTLSDFD
jgi:hypothetical protein